ncbi:hypothetical protein V8E54_013638 [Elaphomyces granulatus]
MPCMVLANISSILGLVNGSRGTAARIIVDAETQFFPIHGMHVMCTKPPRCVLFRPLRSRASNFEGLEDGIVPIFPIERSITIKNNSIRRKQVPMCAAFCVTDYKAQGQTFSEGVVDLKHDSKANGRDCWHEWFNEHQWKLLGTTEE